MSSWLQLYLLLQEENVCVSVAVWHAGACLALIVIWLKEDWSGRQISCWDYCRLLQVLLKTSGNPL